VLEYVALALAGCAVGAVTGLMPGIHLNTVCLVGLGAYPLLGLDAVGFGVLMAAAAMTHTFLDFLPGIFLGVPEEGTVLAVLPAHRLVNAGKGLEAVKLTGYGCLLGLVFGVALLPPAAWLVPAAYRGMRGAMGGVLSAAVLFLVWRERGWRGKVWAAASFLASGAIGLLTLGAGGLSTTYVLFPVFTGLFGLSGLLWSLKGGGVTVPQEPYASVRVDGEVLWAGLKGALGGILVGVLPGMSPSQVGILFSEAFGSSARGFIVSVAAINSSDSIYSLASLYLIGNPRSGVAAMLGRVMVVGFDALLLFVGVFCLSASVAFCIHMEAGRRAASLFSGADYWRVSVAVLAFVMFLVWIFTGWLGVLIAAVSAAVGLLPVLSGVSRTHLMGVLLVPTIMFYSGFSL
jgi:putative membrane protein